MPVVAFNAKNTTSWIQFMRQKGSLISFSQIANKWRKMYLRRDNEKKIKFDMNIRNTCNTHASFYMNM